MRRSQARSLSAATTKSSTAGSSPNTGEETDAKAKRNGNSQGSTASNNSFVLPSESLPNPNGRDEDSNANRPKNEPSLVKPQESVVESSIARAQDAEECDPGEESLEPTLVINPAIQNDFRAAAEVADQNSTTAEPSISIGGEDSSDSFFRSVVTMGGLLIDNPGNANSGIPLKSTLTSTSSVAISIRSAVRGAERSNRFLQGLEMYLGDDIWLRRMLLPIRLGSTSANASRGAGSGPNLEPSLIRVLLRIENIQTKVIERLLEIFAARALDVTDAIDEEVDMVLKKILSVLSWLDFVSDPQHLAEQFLQTLMVLNDAKSAYLREAVQFLPEILPDSEHSQAVEALLKMFKESRSDSACILDAMSNLTLPSQFIQDLIDTVLGSLHSAPKHDVPVLVRFLLATCAQSQDSVIIESTLRELRSRLLFLNERKTSSQNRSKPTCSGTRKEEETNAAEAATVASMVLREIQRAFLLHRPLWSCYLNLVVKHQFHGEYVFLDVWILLSLSRSTQYASIAREGLKRIALSVDGEKVFEDAITNHGATIEPFVGELLEISGSFLRVGTLQKQADRYRSFGARILFLLFEELDELGTLQEVMLCIASHCSQPNKPEVDAVLNCLYRICSTRRGANKLNTFSSYVKSLLNHLERYDIVQARMVFHTVARVCLAGGGNGSDDDELRILLRKLLGCADNSKPQILGIIGTCQLVSVLAPHVSSVDESKTNERQVEPASYAKVQDAITLIDQMLKSTSSPFKFDELARLIEHERLDERAVNALSSMAMDAFEEFYLFDSLPSRTMKMASETKLVVQNQFGIVANEDEMEDSASIVARIYSLVRDSLTGDLRRRHRLEQMASMSRLVMACLLKCVLVTTNNESPNEDSVPFNMLECPFELPLVPDSSSSNEDGADEVTLTVTDKQALVLSYFYACEWMRESINSFSRLLSKLPTSSKTLKKSLEKSLCKRMDLLMECNQIFHKLLSEYCLLVSVPPTSSSIVFSLGLSQQQPSSLRSSSSKKASTSSKAKKKISKKLSSTTMSNNVEEGDEEEEEESSSEDDASEEGEGEATIDPQPKQKKARRIKQSKSVGEDVFNGEPKRAPFLEEEEEENNEEEAEQMEEEEEENHSTTSNMKKMRTTKQNKKKSTNDGQQAAMKEQWISAQRLLSPLCLLLMASGSSASSSNSMLSPESIQMVLMSSLAHFQAHFGGMKKIPNAILHRSEFDSQELKQFVLMNNCVILKSLRKFMETICGEIELDPAQEGMKLKITCVDLIIQLLTLLVSSESNAAMNESNITKQPAFILSLLRGFASPEEEREQLSRSTTTLQASLTRDEATRVDASDLISIGIEYLFDFLSDSVSLRGVFATNLEAQVRVLELLVLLVEFCPQQSGEAIKMVHKRLPRSLGKLAATLCGREWDSTSPNSSFMKCVGRLVEIGLYYSFGLGNPHDDQQKREQEEEEDQEEELENEENSLLGRLIKDMSLRNLNEAETDFPLLKEKTLPVFYTACLSYLGKWKGKMTSIFRLRFAMTCFAHLILITQSREDVKLFKPALKFGKMFLDSLQKNHHMKLLSDNLRTNRELSVGILRTLQKATRQINNLLTHGKSKKDASMLSLAPGMRRSLESILLSCKRILKENDVGDMFVVSFLKARNVDGSLFERKEEDDEEA